MRGTSAVSEEREATVPERGSEEEAGFDDKGEERTRRWREDELVLARRGRRERRGDKARRSMGARRETTTTSGAQKKNYFARLTTVDYGLLRLLDLQVPLLKKAKDEAD